MGLFSKSKWRLVKAHVLMDWKELEAFGFETACELVDKGFATKLYYARYLSNEARRVEFKLYPMVQDHELEHHLLQKPDVTEVTVEPFDGSDTYAEAFAMARLLRGQGNKQAGDVVHWMLNMAGYNYIQEVEFYAQSTTVIAGILNQLDPHA